MMSLQPQLMGWRLVNLSIIPQSNHDCRAPVSLPRVTLDPWFFAFRSRNLYCTFHRGSHISVQKHAYCAFSRLPQGLSFTESPRPTAAHNWPN